MGWRVSIKKVIKAISSFLTVVFLFLFFFFEGICKPNVTKHAHQNRSSQLSMPGIETVELSKQEFVWEQYSKKASEFQSLFKTLQHQHFASDFLSSQSDYFCPGCEAVFSWTLYTSAFFLFYCRFKVVSFSYQCARADSLTQRWSIYQICHIRCTSF